MMRTRKATELPEGELPNDQLGPDGVMIHSLTAHALFAIDRHKWIESEQRGHDAGAVAVGEWLEHCWKGWTRARLLEHLYGWRCWGAFGQSDFGLLIRETVDYHVSRSILEHVAEILANGGENLDVIHWALEREENLDAILWLLDHIDINAKRHRFLTDHIRLFTTGSEP
jgi:hypothetical protein